MSALGSMRHLLHGHMHRCRRGMSSQGIAGADCMWKQLLGSEGGQQLQQLRWRLGQRVLVVSNEKSSSRGSRREYPQASVAMSDREAEIARRTWFELQKFGKQAIFLTLPLTPFPVERTVNDALAFCRRIPGGVTAVIAIGTGVTADVAKAVRALAERDVPSVAANDAIAVTTSDRLKDIPLVTVATTISPVPFCDSWLCLHKEEDALRRRRARAADLVVFDDNIILAADNIKYTNFAECRQSYILLHLSEAGNRVLVEGGRNFVVTSLSGVEGGAAGFVRGSEDGMSALMDHCRAVGAMRNDIEEASAGRAQSPPYFLDVAAYLKGAAILATNRFSAPYSLVAASALLPSLRLIASRDAENNRKGKYAADYKKSADLVVEKAAFLALRSLQEVLDLASVEDLLSSLESDNSRITDVLAAYISASSVDVTALKNANSSESGEMGAASLLEGLIIAEDMADEAKGSVMSQPPVSKGGSGVPAASRADILKSDLVLTICEEFF